MTFTGRWKYSEYIDHLLKCTVQIYEQNQAEEYKDLAPSV